jgi:hypothetical protein
MLNKSFLPNGDTFILGTSDITLFSNKINETGEDLTQS